MKDKIDSFELTFITMHTVGLLFWISSHLSSRVFWKATRYQKGQVQRSMCHLLACYC